MEAKQIIEELGFKCETPIKVHVDNVGAIYIARNNVGRTTTRHVNIRYHYVRELVEQKIIEVVFIKTKDNTSDIMTKNCDKKYFNKHEEKLIEEMDDTNVENAYIHGKVQN